MAESLTPRQLEIARYCRSALKRIFLQRAGGAADDATLDEIKELCLGAMRAVNDPVCGGNLLALHSCAAALYSDRAHHHWDRGDTPGIDVLRRRIFRALNAYQRRLYRLEQAASVAPLQQIRRLATDSSVAAP